MEPLTDIATIDVRAGGPVAHAQARRASLNALRAACLRGLPPGAGPFVPLADALARRWLERSVSPYVAEVAAVAALADGPGVFLVNTAYEWACTAATHAEGSAAPLLVRTLDWPFPGLGRGVTVARQAGPAGEFWNVTWPGAVGVLSAVAAGRFAATINLAPLYRRTCGALLRPLDLSINAVQSWLRVRYAPPAHVLRQVFETAPDYRSAQTMLTEMPVARPVLFSLTGTKPEETCMIERTATSARLIKGRVLVANDWQSPEPGWEPRTCGGPVATDSRDRRAALGAAVTIPCQPFAWLQPPVLNWATRAALEMGAADGTLRVMGYEPVGGYRPARQATHLFDLSAQRAAA